MPRPRSRARPRLAARTAARRRAASWPLPLTLLLAPLVASALLPLAAQTVRTLAGGRLAPTGPDAGFADGASLQGAQFDTPLGLCRAPDGALLVADSANGALRRLEFGRDQTSTAIRGLRRPVALAFDPAAHLYVLEQDAGAILRFDRTDTLFQFPTRVVSNLAQPTALACDGQTNLYVTEAGGTLKRLQPTATNWTLATVATGLASPQGVAWLDSGLVAVSESARHVLSFLDPATGARVRQIGAGLAGFRDGPIDQARFQQPHQLARAPNGSLVVADRFNHRVRVVSVDGQVTTLYGVDPARWEGPCIECNPILLPGWFDGVNGAGATAEAREPVGVTVDAHGQVYVTEAFYHLVRTVTGTGLGGTPGAGGAGTNVVVLPPIVGPTSGYFPTGVELQVLNPNTNDFLRARVFYTTDGSDPAPANPQAREVALAGNAGTIPWRESLRDLASLRVQAFLGDAASSVVAGQPAATNTLGFARDATGGVGATVYLPAVVNLKPGQTLKSVQCLVEVSPVGAAPPLVAPLRAVTMGPADFVPLAAASTNAPITRSESAGGTVRLEIAFIGTNAVFSAAQFAAVTVIAVPIPPTARAGDTYTVRVTRPSGTADGVAAEVPLVALPARTLTVASVSYLVGDSAPAGWLEAGTFGDRDLSNSDVNNAFYASLGVRLPPTASDAFDAMDVFPEDTVAATGGDGKIRFLDWQILLDRSLGLRTNHWTRAWSPAGFRTATATALGLGLDPGSPLLPAPSILAPLRGAWWRPEAELRGERVEGATPGQPVRVPVSLHLGSAPALAGLQFRARVVPAAGAPALVSAVTFEGAAGLPAPLLAAGLPSDQTAAAWALPAAGAPAPFRDGTVLGHVRFVVPPGATVGQAYAVQFERADGAADRQRAVTVDGRAAMVGVQAVAPPDPPVPWRFRLTWGAVAETRYVVESSTDLERWTLEADLAGRPPELEFIDDAPGGAAQKFYRVRRVP